MRAVPIETHWQEWGVSLKPGIFTRRVGSGRPLCLLTEKEALRLRSANLLPDQAVVVLLDRGPGCEQGWKSFLEYQPQDLQRQVAKLCDPVLGSAAGLIGFREADGRHGDVVSAAVVNLYKHSIVFKASRLIGVRNAVSREDPHVVHFGAAAEPYLCALGLVERKPFRWLSPSVLARLAELMAYGVAAITYQLLVKRLFALWHSRGTANWRSLRTSCTLVVGAEGMLARLIPDLESAVDRSAPIQFLLHAAADQSRRTRFPRRLRRRAVYIESIPTFLESCSVAWDALRICVRVGAGVRGATPVPERAVSRSEALLWGLIEHDVRRAVVKGAAHALTVAAVIGKIVGARGLPAALFLADPASWPQEVIRRRMSRHGVPSASYTHGIAEFALGYRAATDLFFVNGRFDACLLKGLGCRSRMYQLGPPEETRMRAANRRKDVLLITGFAGVSDLDRRTGQFLRETMRFLSLPDQASRFERAVIKWHPLEAKATARREEAALRLQFPNLRNRIAGVLSGLEDLLGASCTVFLMPSTVVLDCLELALPFFVFDTGTFDRATFYGQLPEDVMYRSAEELAKKYRNRENDRDVHSRTWRTYYGIELDGAVGRNALASFMRNREIEGSCLEIENEATT